MASHRLILALLVLLVSACSLAAEPMSPTQVPSPPLETLFPADGMAALDHPPAVTGQDASGHLTAQGLVIGVEIAGEARAYPIDFLGRHEVANDTLGGMPILVTFCPLCNSGIVASRRIETAEGPRDLTFDVSGQFLDEAVVMIDRESGSLWPQSRAAALSGPLAGSALELLSSRQVPWAEWQAMYPDTTVMIPPGTPPPSAFFELPGIGETAPSPEFDPAWSGYVMGVAADTQAIALPLEAVAEAQLVRLALGDQALIAVSGTEVGEVHLWRAPADAGSLTLVDGQIQDGASGSLWDAATGEINAGPITEPLEPVDGHLMHWRAWWSWYPESQLWTPDG